MWPWHTTQHSGINRSTHLQPVRTQNLSKTHKLLMVCLHCPEPHPNSTPLAFPVPPPKKIAETNMAQGSYYLSLGFTKKAKPAKTIKKYPASLSEIRLTNASIHQPLRNTTSNGPLEWRWCHWVRSSQLWKGFGKMAEKIRHLKDLQTKNGASLIFDNKKHVY